MFVCTILLAMLVLLLMICREAGGVGIFFLNGEVGRNHLSLNLVDR